MYLPPRKTPPRLLLASSPPPPPSPFPHPPQMNVSKAAGWKALSILSVLIIRFLTAPLIVDHMACLQLEHLLLHHLLLPWFAWLADFPPYAALCWMTCISWWMGETFGPRGSVWKTSGSRERWVELQAKLVCNNSPLTYHTLPLKKHSLAKNIINVMIISTTSALMHFYKKFHTLVMKAQNIAKENEPCSHSAHFPRFFFLPPRL